MYDRYVVSVDLRSVEGLEFGDDLSDGVNFENCRVVEIFSARYGNFRTAAPLGSVVYVRSAVEDVSRYGVERKSRLLSEKFCRFKYGVVERGQFEHIALHDVVAVLRHGRGDRRNGKRVPRGRNTFGKRRKSLVERRELTELDGFAAVLGYRFLLTELVMNEICLRVVEKSHVVECLHLGRKRRLSSYLRCEQLKVDFVENSHCFNLLCKNELMCTRRS